MADAPDESLLGTSHFRVLIGDVEVGFCDVGSLTSRSGDGRRDEARFDAVVLRRALTQSTELYEWRRAVARGADDRRTVTVHQLTGPGGAVANSWRLLGAWPSRWSGPSFNSLRDGIAFEELELAFDDLEWLRGDAADREPPREGG